MKEVRKVCIKCGNLIPEHKYRSAKYCSEKCSSAIRTLKYNIKHGKVQKPGVGSEGNQRGERNNQWKNGKTKFRETAFANYPHVCNRCETTESLLVHHRDENRLNNLVENLEILCKRCHQQHHTIKDKTTGKYIKRQSDPV